MSFWGTIKKKYSKYLPTIRRPQYVSPYYRDFINNYGWVFRDANKVNGDYKFFTEASNNVYVYRSIQIISDTLLINGFSFTNPDSGLINTERVNYLTNLFNNPQGYQSELTYAMFHNQYIKSFELTGDAFIEVNYEKFNWDKDEYYKVINGFQFIPSNLLKWFDDTEQWGYRSKPSIRYDPEELIHIYEPNIELKDSKYGTSKLEKIRVPILMMVLGLDHNRELLENDGIDPRAIISFDKDISDESFIAELERLSELREARKKGGTLAMRGATFQSGSLNNQDMDFLSLMEMCRDMILTAYGVQPGKAGIRETANLGSGTGESQDKDFKDMMNAKARLIEGAFNKKLGHNGFQELFQFNEMDIEDKLKRTQIEQNKLNAGILTINEVRKDYGLEKVPWGDVPLSIQNRFDANETPNIQYLKRYKNNVYKARLINEWCGEKNEW